MTQMQPIPQTAFSNVVQNYKNTWITHSAAYGVIAILTCIYLISYVPALMWLLGFVGGGIGILFYERKQKKVVS